MTDKKLNLLLSKHPMLLAEFYSSKAKMEKHDKIREKIILASNQGNVEKVKRLQEEQEKIGNYKPIAYGIQCDDGWFDLIDELLSKIKELDPENTVKVVQIKEKFGGLRVYTMGALALDIFGLDKIELGSERLSILNLTTEYEKKSLSICEVCGKSGKLRKTKGGYYKTVCDEHKVLRRNGYEPIHFMDIKHE